MWTPFRWKICRTERVPPEELVGSETHLLPRWRAKGPVNWFTVSGVARRVTTPGPVLDRDVEVGVTLDRGEMAEQETVLAHDASIEDAPLVPQEIAGKSPTQIAFSRLRKDKVALVCAVVVVLLVLIAACAPLITRMFGIYWDVSDPVSYTHLTLPTILRV